MIAWLFWGSVAAAEGERAGDFDYLLLALSWTPAYCAAEGDARGNPQCDEGRGLGWTLHGLWPQYEEGWPSYCITPHAEATHAETRAMADIMGSSGLAWHQWKKHGRCTGVSAENYFRASRLAYERVALPAPFTDMDRRAIWDAADVEAAFLKANPDLSEAALTVICRQNAIREVRICLTKSLSPRACAPDTARDCTLENAVVAPIR